MLLKTYNSISFCSGSIRSAASNMTVYASVDGEDYAQVASSTQLTSGISESSSAASCKVVVRNLTKRIQYMQPLFDYGPLEYEYSGKPPVIELYVSTIDDNKELLSNHIAWNPVVLSN